MTATMTSRPIAVYADIVDLDPTPGVRRLEEAGFDVRILDTADPAAIVAGARDAQALLVGYAPVTAQMLAELPELRVVATQSVGVDTVDLEACRTRGVAVRNVPGAATEEVAAHALAMSLALVRGLPFLGRAVAGGVWDGTDERLLRPSELTIGVLGLGRIGAAYARMIRPLVARVVGYDPLAAAPVGVEQGTLDEVLAASDLISLHLPSTEQTRGMFDAERLAQLRPGALLVNVSRGDLVVSEALIGALDDGRVGAAALDVLGQEPPAADDPLVAHPRTLVTPHVAYLSAASARDYVLHQAEAVVDQLAPVAPRARDRG
ncbi:C-terminal binding protein [Nocardioides daejeonensis]|uniref:C-terminal binding protein n=1 Tax=Nocardioides daejeonensis TaxID=1046556 RepID=UPI0019504B99|nr:C-terminal binding protein [Nocardioides daejeonensis]